MTFHLAFASDAALLGSDSAVIRKRDARAFGDALALLHETTTLRNSARDEAAAVRDTARVEGLAEGRDAARDALFTGLTDIARAVEAHAETRRADIAEAAFAAARAIIGEVGDSAVMQQIVDRTIARLDGGKPIMIEVAPALVDALAQHLADQQHVSVVANPDFGPTDCRVLTGSGQIVASLSVQFDALAARWGL